jgi:DNA replicative helicase MCM subunit Mcm2 (Cdc46/Mcm family)
MFSSSRFDLIYLVLDKCEEERDRRLARHLVSLFHAAEPVRQQQVLNLAVVELVRQQHVLDLPGVEQNFIASTRECNM